MCLVTGACVLIEVARLQSFCHYDPMVLVRECQSESHRIVNRNNAVQTPCPVLVAQVRTGLARAY